MSKGLEALHHPRIELARIDISAEGLHDIAYMPFYKTKQYAAIEKELKLSEILKRINFDIVYREQFDEWTLFIIIETQDGKYLELVTFGSGKDQYELLKEVLL